MELHRGRLIDHIQLRCADLAASKRFYAAALGVLGVQLIELAPGLIVADELCLTPANGDPVSHIHLAFQTESRDQVARFHATALAAGGRDNGGPGNDVITPATTRHSYSTRTVTTSKPCTTARRPAQPVRL